MMQKKGRRGYQTQIVIQFWVPERFEPTPEVLHKVTQAAGRFFQSAMNEEAELALNPLREMFKPKYGGRK